MVDDRRRDVCDKFVWIEVTFKLPAVVALESLKRRQRTFGVTR